MRSVADIGLGPTVSTILRGERINTVCTPVTDVGQSGEHEVALRTVSTVGHVGVGTVTPIPSQGLRFGSLQPAAVRSIQLKYALRVTFCF